MLQTQEKSRARVGDAAAVKCDLEDTGGFHLICTSFELPSTSRKSLPNEADGFSFFVSPSLPFFVWSSLGSVSFAVGSGNPAGGGGGSSFGLPVT